MKIDQYYQRQKCSSGDLVSRKVPKFYADIRGGSLESGVVEMAIFASFARYIFRTFTSKATLGPPRPILCCPLVALQ